MPTTNFTSSNTTGMVMRKMPKKSMMMPDLIIFVMGMKPEAYTMALGGVDTGIMKPSEVDRARPTATGMGLIPRDTAVPMAIGAMRLTAAVCEVSSDRNRPVMQKRVTKASSEGLPPSTSRMPSPTHVERPVVYIMLPIASPPPKSSRVPHSMPSIPSFHFRVASPVLKSTGRKKSSRPPIMAASSSGRYLLNSFTISALAPYIMLSIPGVTQMTTASKKAKRVFFWARVHLPNSLA